ncbi:trypsin-like peptidase domain-containing protein [uncultured Paraglaciecola sp.]|uniref:S1C family serine protease n=1 Tax=uncultured Paraglaciecola sp. TaxID=1765024 RepID=UPI00261D2608|nr:trypsin-like peptidase domain-containing protein [uncultured Paraglaciecola sp.]
MLKTLLFLLKSILIGIIISSVILALVPDLRQGSGLPLTLFTQPESSKKISYNSAVNAAGPAVVNIYSQSIERSAYNRRQPIERTSLGSGVIMTSNGYILTCYHVIANAKLILVAFQDGRREEAQIVGYDPITDLAVLNVSVENLHAIPQLDDPKTLVGDLVLALGNPYNLGQTVTQGIVSRINNNGLNNFFDYIQTDAVLNEGNSGGALVDSEGYLVGINNANFQTRISRSRVESVDGVSFAVPYNLAKKVMDEIIATGKVTRGALGFVGAQERPNSTGIIVTAVSQGSPAEAGGLQIRDLILSVDKLQTTSIRDTLDYISNTTPGQTVTFKVNRNGKIIELQMVVAELQ